MWGQAVGCSGRAPGADCEYAPERAPKPEHGLCDAEATQTGELKR